MIELRVRFHEDAGTAVVCAQGELDVYEAPGLRALLTELVDQGYRRLVTDLSGVSFVDVAGIRALVDARRHATVAGAELVVVAQPQLGRLVAIANLQRVLPLCRSVAEAWESGAGDLRQRKS